MNPPEFIQKISMMYSKTNIRTLFRDEKLHLPKAMDVMAKKDFSEEYYKQRIADLEEYFYPKPV